jgi:hypothetical protein
MQFTFQYPHDYHYPYFPFLEPPFGESAVVEFVDSLQNPANIRLSDDAGDLPKNVGHEASIFKPILSRISESDSIRFSNLPIPQRKNSGANKWRAFAAPTGPRTDSKSANNFVNQVLA